MKTLPLAAGARRIGFGHRVRRFERRNDAFRAREQARRVQRLGIGSRHVLGAALIVQPGVLGTDHGVIEPGGDGVRERDLAVVILQARSCRRLAARRARRRESAPRVRRASSPRPPASTPMSSTRCVLDRNA